MTTTPEPEPSEREALMRLGAQAARDRDACSVAQVVTATVDAILATRPAPVVSADGVALIAAERRRHVEVEGYTPEGDAGRADDLSLAGAMYATPAPRRTYTAFDQETPARWPWHRRFWKPTPDDRVRELVKAGALIAAAIDSLLAVTPAEDDQDACECPSCVHYRAVNAQAVASPAADDEGGQG